MTVVPDELLTVAVAAARAAGGLLRRFADEHADTSLDVESKTSPTDPVSEADRASERLLAEHLLSARPDDGLLGEEDQASRRGTTGLRWVVDPLDGTVNFLYGIPAWCVSVACEDDEGSLVGVVHDPNRAETFTAVRGQGAHRDGVPLTVTSLADPGRALVATGFAYEPQVRSAQGHRVADLLTRVRDVRRGGSAALDLAWTAAGRFDGYLEAGLSPWDWAAGTLLVREAGGVISRPDAHLGGRTLPAVVAGNRPVHDHLRAWHDHLESRGTA